MHNMQSISLWLSAKTESNTSCGADDELMLNVIQFSLQSCWLRALMASSKYLKNNATKNWTAGFSAELPVGKLVKVTADEVNHALQCLAENWT